MAAAAASGCFGHSSRSLYITHSLCSIVAAWPLFTSALLQWETFAIRECPNWAVYRASRTRNPSGVWWKIKEISFSINLSISPYIIESVCYGGAQQQQQLYNESEALWGFRIDIAVSPGMKSAVLSCVIFTWARANNGPRATYVSPFYDILFGENRAPCIIYIYTDICSGNQTPSLSQPLV